MRGFFLEAAVKLSITFAGELAAVVERPVDGDFGLFGEDLRQPGK